MPVYATCPQYSANGTKAQPLPLLQSLTIKLPQMMVDMFIGHDTGLLRS